MIWGGSFHMIWGGCYRGTAHQSTKITRSAPLNPIKGCQVTPAYKAMKITSECTPQPNQRVSVTPSYEKGYTKTVMTTLEEEYNTPRNERSLERLRSKATSYGAKEVLKAFAPSLPHMDWNTTYELGV